MSNILFDMHTHTAFSPDAKDGLDAMCARAALLGLKHYAVTDHCDCNYWFGTEHYFGNKPKAEIIDSEMYGAGEYAQNSIKAQVELKQRLAGSLDLIIGVELGQPLQYPEGASVIADNENVDFIIGSHHMNKGVLDFYYLDYGKMTAAELDTLLTDYFTQMLEMCRWGRFDVLGHLTYPLRYICGEYGIEVDLGRYDDIIREIFCTLIRNGKGIEINTSGLRQKYGMTFPTLEYVRLYRELGGEILTVGSDAHCAADLAKGINEGIETARAAGFKRLAYFKEHKPLFEKI